MHQCAVFTSQCCSIMGCRDLFLLLLVLSYVPICRWIFFHSVQMASHDDDRLDFNKLQKELDAAVEQDARYWLENDAKIRAVSTQRVATYEEFK